MPRKRESVGKALRLALGEEVVLQRIEARKPGVSQLMNERRLRIFEAVYNNPGIHVRELQRLLGIPLQSLRWHLRVLSSARFIQTEMMGNRGLLFAPISISASKVMSSAISRDERFLPILRMLEGRDEMSIGKLASSTGIYQQLISARMKKLTATGLVEVIVRGQHKGYRIHAAQKTMDTEPVDKMKIQKEALVMLLRDQGLIPRIVSQASGVLTVIVDRGVDEVTLKLKAPA